jgi:hypothetical protein
MKEEREYHITNKQENIKSKEAMKKEYDGVDKGNTFDITEKTQEHDERIANLKEFLNSQRQDLIKKYQEKY